MLNVFSILVEYGHVYSVMNSFPTIVGNRFFPSNDRTYNSTEERSRKVPVRNKNNTILFSGD